MPGSVCGDVRVRGGIRFEAQSVQQCSAQQPAIYTQVSNLGQTSVHANHKAQDAVAHL